MTTVTTTTVSCPTLTATDLACGFGKTTIVSGVSLTMRPGERWAFIGTNGAGKSTLLRTIAGITPALSGTISLGDQSMSEVSTSYRAQQIAFVGQEESPPADLLVHELVALGRIPHRRPWAGGGSTERSIVEQALAQVSLDHKATRQCSQLSGGERRRAMIARGLAQQSPIVMLDEPTNHLDVHWQLTLLDMLTEHDGLVVAAMHDLDLVNRYFSHVAIVHNGGVFAAGTPAEALTTEVVSQAFNVKSTTLTNPMSDQSHIVIYDTTERK